MTYVTTNTNRQNSRINTVVIGVLSTLVAFGAGFLAIAGFVAA